MRCVTNYSRDLFGPQQDAPLDINRKERTSESTRTTTTGYYTHSRARTRFLTTHPHVGHFYRLPLSSDGPQLSGVGIGLKRRAHRHIIVTSIDLGRTVSHAHHRLLGSCYGHSRNALTTNHARAGSEFQNSARIGTRTHNTHSWRARAYFRLF